MIFDEFSSLFSIAGQKSKKIFRLRQAFSSDLHTSGVKLVVVVAAPRSNRSITPISLRSIRRRRGNRRLRSPLIDSFIQRVISTFLPSQYTRRMNVPRWFPPFSFSFLFSQFSGGAGAGGGKTSKIFPRFARKAPLQSFKTSSNVRASEFRRCS